MAENDNVEQPSAEISNGELGVIEKRQRRLVCVAIMRDYMASDLTLEQLETVRENILYSLNND